MEHPLRQTDLHRGEAPQGQQQHPGGPRQMKITQPLQQQEAAKSEINKPFQYEEELRIKSARLAELDAELNIGGVSKADNAA